MSVKHSTWIFLSRAEMAFNVEIFFIKCVSWFCLFGPYVDVHCESAVIIFLSLERIHQLRKK